MAKSSMPSSFLFSVAVLFFLQATSARDIEFFSKFTKEDTNTKILDENKSNINAQEGLMPTKEESSQEPTFVPQTIGDNGYGLYGHETGVLPPSTTSTDTSAVASNIPFESRYEEPLNNYNTNRNDKYPYNMEKVEKRAGDEGTSKEDQAAYFYNKAMYYSNRPKYQGLSGKEYNGNGGADSRNGIAYNYNLQEQQQQQGMSDTRFLDNGRYYYDVNSERRNEPAAADFGYSNYNNNENVNNGYFSNSNSENVNPYRYNNIGTPYKNQEDREFTVEP